MNYYFTGLLVLAFTILVLFVEPAYPRNEYLNEYGVRCGEFETRVEAEDRNGKYNHYNDNNNYRNDDDNYRLSFTYRKYLGTDCKTTKENVAIKQQLELMKMCGRVNSNPSLAHNPNFKLLVSKCRGVSPTSIDNRPMRVRKIKIVVLVIIIIILVLIVAALLELVVFVIIIIILIVAIII